MAVSLKHATQAVGTDAGNGEIAKAEWNDEHDLTMSADFVLGRATAGNGAVEEIACTAFGRSLIATADADAARTVIGVESITPEHYGCVGDGTTNDTTNFQAALDAAATSGSTRTVRLEASKYRLDSITIPANVMLAGLLPTLDTTSDNIDADYTALQGSLLLNSGATINVNKGASARDLIVYPFGHTYPQSSSSAWVGTAFTYAGYGAQIVENWIIGFDTAITATNFSRLHIYNNAIDCNNGIYVAGSYDTTLIAHNHCWPYATHKHYADPGLGGGANQPASALYRTGTGLHLDTGNDDTRVNDNLFFGYLVGIQVDAGALSLGENWVDHPNAAARSGNYGIVFGEGASKVKSTNLFVWGTNTGVYFDQLSTEDVSILNLSINTIDGDAISVDSGTADIAHLDCDGIGGNAIQFNSNSVRFRVGAGHLVNVTGTLFSLAASMTSENFIIGQVYTDQAAGTLPTETNVQTTPVIASASPLNLPMHGDFFRISGTTGFSSIAGSYTGRRVTLWFDDALTISTGGNLKIAGSYTTTIHDTIELRWDGFEWLEISRSVNA